jgi:hypothetical protein
LKDGIRLLASDPEKLQLGFSAAEILPCLESLIPTGPAEDPALRAVNPKGILTKLSSAISDYIDLEIKKSEHAFD